MSRLIIYDTINYVDFPIGGELTSIGNFLKYLCEKRPERVERLLLVGITVHPEQVGQLMLLRLSGRELPFLPVAAAEQDLSNVGKSLRLQFARGLLKYGRRLRISPGDCNFIHTPEAYGVVKLLCPRTHCVIYSHGSYFNMEKGFRFFRKNLLIKKGFVLYLKWILRNADLIFILDEDSRRDYEGYNRKLIKVRNSIVPPEDNGRAGHVHDGRRLLFVGRLSKDKRVEPIIRAVEGLEGDYRLTIVGDGEEYRNLAGYAGDRIRFTGAVPPSQVPEYLREADILIMNSVFEGMPMTILEALSFGLPVVSTNVGGIGEILRFGGDSEQTDGTPEQIREAVRRIASDYGTYSKEALASAEGYDYRTVCTTVYDALRRYWK